MKRPQTTTIAYSLPAPQVRFYHTEVEASSERSSERFPLLHQALGVFANRGQTTKTPQPMHRESERERERDLLSIHLKRICLSVHLCIHVNVHMTSGQRTTHACAHDGRCLKILWNCVSTLEMKNKLNSLQALLLFLVRC